MPEEEKTKLRLEIGHVLFIDLVGYSKLLIEEQTEVVQELSELVRKNETVRETEAAQQLVRLPAGDGMALVFTSSAEAPVECALELGRALRNEMRLPVRMGIHSGPVQQVADVNDRSNIAGGGINIAQRVMDCGDAGHILLSKRVADDLAHYRQWRPYLHDLGECEVKHATVLGLSNFYGDDFGNPAVPEKVEKCRRKVRRASLIDAPVFQLTIALLVIGALLGGWLLYRHRHTAKGTIPEKSIAVLPFDNLSDDPANAFFADGMQDEILTHLSKLTGLKVISRTSVMQYRGGARNLREIGKQLGVATLLEGSVQRASNKVRVNAQLIDTRTDAHLWAQSYDRDLADVFAIQSEIASTIAGQLSVTLSQNEKAGLDESPTKDVAAFDQYTRAKTLLLTTEISPAQEKNYFEAIDLLSSAVARDPSFHAAYCSLVDAHDQVYSLGYDRTPSRLEAAEAALQKVVELKPAAAETHLTRGRHLYYAKRDYKGALEELEIARVSLPNDPRVFATTGYILRRQGKIEEGVRALEQAVAVDPRNVFLLTQVALSYQLLRQYPEEAAIIDRAREIAPDDTNFAGTRALIDLLAQAKTKPLHDFIEWVRTERPGALSDSADYWLFCALAERDWTAAEQALAALGTNPLISDPPITLGRQLSEGVLARAMGDEDRARRVFTAARAEQQKVVDQQRDYGPALSLLGLLDAALGNKDAALEEGRRAMQLLPSEKDALGAQRLAVYYGMIAAWAGDKDLAMEQLTTYASSPGGSLIASYGVLKLLPFWDPLRGDPRFEQLLASFAPKSEGK